MPWRALGWIVKNAIISATLSREIAKIPRIPFSGYSHGDDVVVFSFVKLQLEIVMVFVEISVKIISLTRLPLQSTDSGL
jgi:hypothetical protein